MDFGSARLLTPAFVRFFQNRSMDGRRFERFLEGMAYTLSRIHCEGVSLLLTAG